MCPVPLLIWEVFWEGIPKPEKRTRETGPPWPSSILWAVLGIYSRRRRRGMGRLQRRHSAIYKGRINKASWTPQETFPSLSSFQKWRCDFERLGNYFFLHYFLICLLSLQFQFLVWRPRMPWCELCLQDNCSLAMQVQEVLSEVLNFGCSSALKYSSGYVCPLSSWKISALGKG